MQSLVTRILASPHRRTLVVGARPLAQRVLLTMFLGFAAGTAAAQATTTTPQTPSATPNPSEAHWAELPRSAFLDAGLRHDGSFSELQMLGAWQAAGMTSKQASAALTYLPALAPTLLGGRDAALEATLREEADAAAGRLSERFPDAEQQLLKGARAHAPTGEAWQALVEQVQRSGAEPSRTGFDTRVSMPQARAALEHAVHVAGLRSVRLPLYNWRSAAHLDNLARGIVQANADLARVTGWQGQVLGLGGRVEFAPGKPLSQRLAGAEGYAEGSRDGRVQLISEWKTLAHEWFHALDYTVAQLSFDASRSGTMSDGLGNTQGVRRPQMQRDWQHTQDALAAASPLWQAARVKVGTLPNGAYWVDRSEGMAYAFSAYLSRTGQPVALREDTLEMGNRVEPFRSPGAAETKGQTGAWNAFFASVGTLNLSQATPQTQLGALRLARLARNEDAASTVKLSRTLR